MNVENFSRKVVVCWYPTRRYWLDISDYTRYIPRVVTDGYRDHPKDGSSSTSHMKFWQEAGVQYKNTILTILNWSGAGGVLARNHKSLLPTMTSAGPRQSRPRIAVGLSVSSVPLSDYSDRAGSSWSCCCYCWGQKQSNEPPVNKKCSGSLSIYYYDILPRDIPKYVKKLVF